MASVIKWCLEPGLRRPTGLGPVWSPFERAEVGGVDQNGGKVQQPRGAQFGEQTFVQLLPDAGRVPLGQPPPAGRARSTEQSVGNRIQPIPARTT